MTCIEGPDKDRWNPNTQTHSDLKKPSRFRFSGTGTVGSSPTYANQDNTCRTNATAKARCNHRIKAVLVYSPEMGSEYGEYIR